jgi:hypothetical protein
MVPRGSLRGRRGSGIPAEREEEGGRGKIDISSLFSLSKAKNYYFNRYSVRQQI